MQLQIISAVMEPESNLIRTAESIIGQKYQKWIWFIANGGSCNTILDRIAELKDPRIILSNEHDDGIYDAWNKALKKSRADWTLFLGSGDILADPEVLQQVFETLKDEDPAVPRIAFGHCRLISHLTGNILREQQNNWTSMCGNFRYGKPSLPIHPEVFHSAGLLSCANPFDTTYEVAGDIDVMLRAIRISSPLTMNLTVTEIVTGGKSQKSSLALTIFSEVQRACRNNGTSLPLWVVYKEFCRSLLKFTVGVVLGEKYYETCKNQIQELRNKSRI